MLSDKYSSPASVRNETYRLMNATARLRANKVLGWIRRDSERVRNY